MNARLGYASWGPQRRVIRPSSRPPSRDPVPLFMHNVKIEKFSGPLDLLLQLVEREKLAIDEVAISQVADQFVQHMKMAEVPPEELADFLLIAAKLLYIKSKILIPQLIDEELEQGIGLEDQLRMYKEFLHAAKGLQQRLHEKQVSFARDKVPFIQQKGFYPPRLLVADKLAQVCQALIESLRPILALPAKTLARAVSIQEKIKHLKDLVLRRSRLLFGQWIKDAKDRTEVVVSFLALLEMVKQRHVMARQETLFTEITIDKL